MCMRIPADPRVPVTQHHITSTPPTDGPVSKHAAVLHFGTNRQMDLNAQGTGVGHTFLNLGAMYALVYRFLACLLGLVCIYVVVEDCAKTYGHPYESVEMGPLSRAYKWMVLLLMSFRGFFPWAYASTALQPSAAAAAAAAAASSSASAPASQRPARAASAGAGAGAPSPSPHGTGFSSLALYSKSLLAVIPPCVFAGAQAHRATNGYVNVFTLRDGTIFSSATHPSVPRSTKEIVHTALALAETLNMRIPPALLVFKDPTVLAAVDKIVAELPPSLLITLRDARGRADVAGRVAATALPPELRDMLMACLINAASLSFANKRALDVAAVSAGFAALGGLTPSQRLLSQAVFGSGGGKVRALAVRVGDSRGDSARFHTLQHHLDAMTQAGDGSPHPLARRVLLAVHAADPLVTCEAPNLRLLVRAVLDRLEAVHRGELGGAAAGALASAAADALHALPADGRGRALAAARPAWEEAKLARAAPHAAGGDGGGSSAAQRGGGSRRGGSSSSSIVGGARPELRDAMRVLQKIDAGECDLVCLVCVCCARLPFSPYPALPTPRGAPHTPLRTCL